MDNEAKAALKRAVGMLEGILERQIEVHKEMLVVADAKKDSIIKGDIALLENTVAEEKKLIGRIEEEEKKRLAVMPLVKRASASATTSSRSSTLSSISRNRKSPALWPSGTN